MQIGQPLSPLDMVGDGLEYADMDFRSYGPINYKAASIYAMVKKNKGGALKEVNQWWEIKAEDANLI